VAVITGSSQNGGSLRYILSDLEAASA
jgi:hypothetical protein